MKNIILVLLILSSCVSNNDKGELVFRDLEAEKKEKIDQKKREERRILQEIKEEKKRIVQLKDDQVLNWDHIVKDARKSFKKVAPIFKKKCIDCHNKNKQLIKLKQYFKYFRDHRQNGINALDYSNIFPLRALNNPSQLSMLRSLRDTVMDKTMPIKAYTRVYPWLKLSTTDTMSILRWVNPLIKRIEDHDLAYSELDDNSLDSQALKVFQNKCIRCHGYGKTKGKFGRMQNLKELVLNKKYVDLENPEQSKIYSLSVSGKMPPNKNERLNDDELNTILEWIKSKSE